LGIFLKELENKGDWFASGAVDVKVGLRDIKNLV